MHPVIPVIIFLLISAFFSGIETAFASSNKLKIEVDKGRKLFSASLLSHLSKNHSVFIGTLWCGNIIALVFYSLFGKRLILDHFAVASPTIFTSTLNLIAGVITLSIVYIFIAELLPRIIFRLNPNGLLKFFALPVYILYIIFLPIIKLFIFIAELILKYIFRVKSEKKEYTFDTSDLDSLLDETSIETEKGKEDFNELQMFKKARDLSNIKLRDFMVPRNEIIAVNNEEDVDCLSSLIVESGHSKILVYDQSIDNIIGYTHAYDIFAKPTTINEIIKPVIYVPGTMTADKLLNTFILERKSVAVVVDEFGGTAGMLTIEDILEEIFGDIDDEYDTEDYIDKQISENEFLVSGRLEIVYLNEKYKLGIPESDDYNTIAGYVIHEHENIPAENEQIIINNLTFTVNKASESKIELLIITVNS
ncbi:MAG: hemolysin family protein [Omnitrophica WOR_2 bacterium]|jgi:CBS domain containing-hemolysin-like protein